MQESENTISLWEDLKIKLTLITILLAAMWGTEILDWMIFGDSLNSLGIRPRRIDGLKGILLAPFLHGDFSHLIANTVPFAVLGALIALRGLAYFFLVFISAMLVGGLGTWLIGGADTVHIGASGVVFGFFGFSLFRGVFERKFVSIALSALVAFSYGGLIWGVLPGHPCISWEGHLFGFIGGIIAARIAPNESETSANL